MTTPSHLTDPRDVPPPLDYTPEQLPVPFSLAWMDVTSDGWLDAVELVRGLIRRVQADGSRIESLVGALAGLRRDLGAAERAAEVQDAAVASLREELRVQTDLAALNAEERAIARNEANRLRGALDDFKDQVRVVALRVKRDQDWCTSGFNSAMEELGLPPFVGPIRASMNFRVVLDNIEVADGETVEEAARRAMREVEGRIDGFDIDDVGSCISAPSHDSLDVNPL